MSLLLFMGAFLGNFAGLKFSIFGNFATRQHRNRSPGSLHFQCLPPQIWSRQQIFLACSNFYNLRNERILSDIKFLRPEVLKSTEKDY